MTSSDQINAYIAKHEDWRGELLSQLRQMINQADPDIQEEYKWDVPVFLHNGMVCAISAFKDHVKINFFKGAALKDPHKLINNGFDSKNHRAIDFSEGDKITTGELTDLIKEAVNLNRK